MQTGKLLRGTEMLGDKGVIVKRKQVRSRQAKMVPPKVAPLLPALPGALPWPCSISKSVATNCIDQAAGRYQVDDENTSWVFGLGFARAASKEELEDMDDGEALAIAEDEFQEMEYDHAREMKNG